MLDKHKVNGSKPFKLIIFFLRDMSERFKVFVLKINISYFEIMGSNPIISVF